MLRAQIDKNSERNMILESEQKGDKYDGVRVLGLCKTYNSIIANKST